MHFVRIGFTICLYFFLLICSQPSTAAAAEKPILYIPLDDRPVCLSYVVETMEAAGFSVITPPADLLASRGRDGDPAKLWKWLYQNAGNADAAILATDSLVYGGLVPSRRHNLSSSILSARVAEFRKLKTDFPNLRIYAFSTLMRTPMQSFGGMEPDYYEGYGNYIFRLTALLDKEETDGLTSGEKVEMLNLKQLIPLAVNQDWFARRQKNMDVNTTLVTLAREQIFHYLVIGKDDNAPLSQTHREARRIKQQTSDIDLARFQLIPGVDQLGLLLLARSVHEKSWERPYIAVQYADGTGASTLPLYSDQKIGESIDAQIFALGGTPTYTPEDAKLLLAVNTPANGITQEANSVENLPFSSPSSKRLADSIADLVKQKKLPVAVADVAYANGADNGFMTVLSKNGALPELAAYAGWNTADNKIGYALAQGILSTRMAKEKRADLLRERLLDDWAYQANIRKMLLTDYIQPGKLNPYRLGMSSRKLQLIVTDEMESFQRANPALGLAAYDYTFPWNRLFEIQVSKRPSN